MLATIDNSSYGFGISNFYDLHLNAEIVNLLAIDILHIEWDYSPSLEEVLNDFFTLLKKSTIGSHQALLSIVTAACNYHICNRGPLAGIDFGVDLVVGGVGALI